MNTWYTMYTNAVYSILKNVYYILKHRTHGTQHFETYVFRYFDFILYTLGGNFGTYMFWYIYVNMELVHIYVYIYIYI